MKTVCLLLLALSVLSVESKAATRKRGIPSLLTDGYLGHDWSDYGLNNHGFDYNFGSRDYFPSHYAAEIPLLARLEHGGPLIQHDFNFGPELSLAPIQQQQIISSQQVFGSQHRQLYGSQQQLVFNIPQTIIGGVPKQNGYKTGFGLGAYGVPSDYGGQKYTSTSNDDQDHVPKVTVPVSGYTPAYPPFTQIPVSTPRTSFPTAVVSKPQVTPQIAPQVAQQQPVVTLGSGGLGVVRLSNGNYALGSGSIGYGGSAPIVGGAQANKRSPQVFSAQPPSGSNFGGPYL